MEEGYKDELKKEIEKVESDEFFSSQFKIKKTIIWLVRTVFAAVLYYCFWEHKWVKWSLIFYVPLNLFGLFVIYGGNYFLKKRTNKLKKKNEL